MFGVASIKRAPTVAVDLSVIRPLTNNAVDQKQLIAEELIAEELIAKELTAKELTAKEQAVLALLSSEPQPAIRIAKSLFGERANTGMVNLTLRDLQKKGLATLIKNERGGNFRWTL